MKKLILVNLMLLALSHASMAQIPNNGFEHWTVYGNGMLPNGWWSTNDSVSSSATYFPITRSSDHFPANVGEYSIRIANNTALLPDWAGLGITWPGEWDGNNSPSFPVAGHPNSLCGYYKFLPENNDSMRIFIALYDGGVEVAQAELMDTVTISSWTPFILPIPSYTTADSARIMLSAFDADAFHVNGNSVLYVDNLSFDNLIISVSENDLTRYNLKIFPNPASDFMYVESDSRDKIIMLNIYNISGLLVKSLSLKGGDTRIDLRELDNGVYLVSLKTENTVLNQKLLIQR